MPGTEAEHEASDGDGRVAAPPAGEPTSAGDGRERTAALAPAFPTEAGSHDTTTGAATTGADPALGRADAGVPAEQADVAAAGNRPEEVTGTAGISDQEFNLAVDVIYHRARASWFALEHRAFLFVTIMAGSTAAADLANAKICALVAAAFGTLDLVLDPTGRMVEHRDLARDTLAIVADLHRNGFSAEAQQRASEEEFRLSANETAPFTARRDMARNQAITAFGKPDDDRVWIPWERWLTANVIRWEGWQDANPRRLDWLRRLLHLGGAGPQS